MLSIWTLAIGCAPGVGTVPGVYVDKKSLIYDTLIIKVNNCYIHKAKINSIQLTQVGKWTYSSGELCLSDYIFFEKNTVKKYIWIAEMKAHNDSLHIIINNDTQESFIKIN